MRRPALHLLRSWRMPQFQSAWRSSVSRDTRGRGETIDKPQRIWLMAVLLIAFFGAGIIAYSTAWGPWADDDSVEYFEVARNIALGLGPIQRRASGAISPLSLRPPFYSFVLSPSRMLGIDMLAYARWLNVVLFAAFIILIGIAALYVCKRSLLAIILGILIATSPTFIEVFSRAMAEPVFFVTGMASVFMMLLYLRDHRWTALVVSALFAGLSAISRFNGTAFIAANAAGVIMFRHGSLKTKARDVILYIGISALPFFANALSVNLGGDTLGIYDFSAKRIWPALIPMRLAIVDAIWRWFSFASISNSIGYRLKLLILGVIASIILVSTVLFFLRRQKEARRALLADPSLELSSLLLLFFAINMLLMAFSSIYMVIPKAVFNERQLSPLQFSLYVSLFGLAFLMIRAWPLHHAANLVPVALAAVIGFTNLQAVVPFVKQMHDNGRGITSKAWHDSDIIEEVRNLPDDLTLISNEAEAILFWTERPTYRIPEIWERKHFDAFYTFGDDENDKVQRAFRDEGAALILFHSAYWQLYPMYKEDTEERLRALTSGLYQYYQGGDGAIYFYRSAYAP